MYDPAPVAGGLASGLEVGGQSVERFYHHLFKSDVVARKWIADMGLGGSLEDLPASMGFYSAGELRRFGTPVSLLRFKPPPVGRSHPPRSPHSGPQRHPHRLRPLRTSRRWTGCAGALRSVSSRSFWIPLLEAKFGDDRDLVSMAWLWARFRARVGGSIWEPERLGYLRGGFQQLGDKLVERAKGLGVEVHLNTRVLKLIVEDGAIKGVQTDPLGEVAADAVMWTPSLNVLAKAVPELDEDYRQKCAALRYHHAVVMVVELAESVLPYYWVTVGDRGLPFTVAVEHTHLVGTSDYSGRTVVYLGRYAAPRTRSSASVTIRSATCSWPLLRARSRRRLPRRWRPTFFAPRQRSRCCRQGGSRTAPRSRPVSGPDRRQHGADLPVGSGDQLLD